MIFDEVCWFLERFGSGAPATRKRVEDASIFVFKPGEEVSISFETFNAIARSSDRPTYTLLTVPEIRKIIAEPASNESTGRHTAPHQRRRHWRNLNSEKFVNKRGEKIMIPATWVGPQEATVGGRRYKVRIDL